MPKKIRFEWDLPDALVDAVASDESQLADTIKQAAVLDWVRTNRLSLRHGAELLGMPYRAFPHSSGFSGRGCQSLAGILQT
jgi:hypothetical protein